MLISITDMVIISRQHFLYNPTIFIPINATSIPAPTRHPPQTSILISQYIILATTGLDIPSLICATFFPVSDRTVKSGTVNGMDRIDEQHTSLCKRDCEQ